jgi:hypothetical protein
VALAAGGLALSGKVKVGAEDKPEPPRVFTDLPACDKDNDLSPFQFTEEPDGTVHVISVNKSAPVDVPTGGDTAAVVGVTAEDVTVVSSEGEIDQRLRFGEDTYVDVTVTNGEGATHSTTLDLNC